MLKNPKLKNLTKQQKQKLLNNIDCLGRFGEEWFRLYLIHNLGHRIITRNFSYKIGEIDIVSIYKDSVFFWEVKSRSSIKYGYPEDAVRQRKLIKLKKGVEIFLKNRPDLCGFNHYLKIVSLIITNNKVQELVIFEVE